MKRLSETENVNEINDHLAVRAFDEHLTYSELLFTTIPGITGMLLITITLIMAITSMQ